MRKELWFGFSLMTMIIVAILVFMPWGNITNGHIGLLMLALIVVAIMLGFPTAFTLMGMGVFFAWYSYYTSNPSVAIAHTLDLFVQRTYGVMSNDVLIAVPLFLFMGYLVERAQLIDRLFKSLHLATVRVPGSLAVATIVTCAIFATATGIVGAVVTLMGLLAFPAMLKAGYNVKVAAGAVTAGGAGLGILIPPSVLLIVYGATAGVSVVQLYAGAFLPGLMLAGLYIAYVIILAKWKPALMPPLSESEQRVPIPEHIRPLSQRGPNPFTALWGALRSDTPGVRKRTVVAQTAVTMVPAIFIVAMLGWMYSGATAPAADVSTAGLVQAGAAGSQEFRETEVEAAGGLAVPPSEEPATGTPAEPGATPKEPGASPAAEPPQELGAGTSGEVPKTETPQELGAGAAVEAPKAEAMQEPAAASGADKASGPTAGSERVPAPTWFWVVLAIGVGLLLLVYWMWNWERLEVFKMLLTSFFPLSMLILAVLGSIVFGLATPAEAAAVGAFGGFMMVAVYRYISLRRVAGPGQTFAVAGRTARDFYGIVKESSFLTAKTSAMVCWLFVGSGIFSAAFALLGGQEVIEKWVLSMNLTPLQFMILAQFIIFLLGWPLEWTEIIVIFMPIFIPLLPHFNIDPLFFGLLVALNLQTAFLSPPVAMSAFYLKGVSPAHVTLNQIFAGMMPFMGIQVIALILLYMFPAIGLWLPSVLYK